MDWGFLIGIIAPSWQLHFALQPMQDSHPCHAERHIDFRYSPSFRQSFSLMYPPFKGYQLTTKTPDKNNSSCRDLCQVVVLFLCVHPYLLLLFLCMTPVLRVFKLAQEKLGELEWEEGTSIYISQQGSKGSLHSQTCYYLPLLNCFLINNL